MIKFKTTVCAFDNFACIANQVWSVLQTSPSATSLAIAAAFALALLLTPNGKN